MIDCGRPTTTSSQSELSRDIFRHRIRIGFVKFDSGLCLNRTGSLLTLTILRHLSSYALRMNTPSLITLFVNPSTPDDLLVALRPNLKSRRFLFTYEFLTQSCTFYVVADQY
jgi:hypothetical protein